MVRLIARWDKPAEVRKIARSGVAMKFVCVQYGRTALCQHFGSESAYTRTKVKNAIDMPQHTIHVRIGQPHLTTSRVWFPVCVDADRLVVLD